MKASKALYLSVLLAVGLSAGTLEGTLTQTGSYSIAGEFASYDFNSDGKIAPSDWTFKTSDGSVYQLLGDTSDANVAKVGVFGWKLLSNFTPKIPSFYLAFLGQDIDGDGSTKFDWVVIDDSDGAVYKLAGQDPVNKSFKYGNTTGIKASVNKETKKIAFTSTTTTSTASFRISSSSYTNGSEIASKYSCQGTNISPQYSWANAPANTSSYALIMDDEVSPCGTGDQACKHWSVFNITSSTSSLNENASTSGLVQGANYAGGVGYEGPCPPTTHTYKTTVYALNSSMPTIASGTGLTRSQFESSYKSYIVGSDTISGTFAP